LSDKTRSLSLDKTPVDEVFRIHFGSVRPVPQAFEIKDEFRPKSPVSHKVNLFDLHHKYTDVMKLEEVKEQLGASGQENRPKLLRAWRRRALHDTR